MKKKLIVTGHAHHGKDTFCEMLEELFGYRSVSSSAFMSPFIFEKIGKLYGYKNLEECWNDKKNHRKEWFDIIVEYNTPDLSRLGREIFREHEIYNGIRNITEFDALKNKGLYDLSIWIDSSERLPAENSSSMTISMEDCDLVFDNNEIFKKNSKKHREKVYSFIKANSII